MDNWNKILQKLKKNIPQLILEAGVELGGSSLKFFGYGK